MGTLTVEPGSPGVGTNSGVASSDSPILVYTIKMLSDSKYIVTIRRYDHYDPGAFSGSAGHRVIEWSKPIRSGTIRCAIIDFI